MLELVGEGVNPCLHPGAVLSASHVASACWPVTDKLDRLKGELDKKALGSGLVRLRRLGAPCRRKGSYKEGSRRPAENCSSAAPPSATQRSSRVMSAALCHRSSGSFARHVLTTRPSAGGVVGWIECQALGSVLRWCIMGSIGEALGSVLRWCKG